MNGDKNSAINGLTGTTLQKIKELVDETTVVGNPISLRDGTTIIPVTKVTIGFASGGSDVGTKTAKEMFGGGSGAGVTIAPVGFIVVNEKGVKLLQLNSSLATVDNFVQTMPEMLDKIVALSPQKPQKTQK